MAYFETKHEKDSAKVTTLITVILVLLLFIVGQTYMDPPEEYGVAVNFGTTDFGSGKVQPKEPIKSTPQEVKEKPQEPVEEVEEVQPEETQSESASAESKAEEVLTEENAEAIAMKKQKAKEAAAQKAKEEAERKEKAEAERKERAKKEAAEKERKAKEAKKKALDEMMGGLNKSDGTATGGEGDDNTPGDKGQIDGNPYAPYKGIPGFGNGGMGYGLNGRGKAKFGNHEGCTNEYGLVVVDIVVNQEGKVIKATSGVRGSTNLTECLKNVAKKIAFSGKWNPDKNAPQRQFGRISINFTPN